jgi:ABC-type phosphate transport system substrate-binding protein
MRILSRLITGAAVTTAAMAMAVAPAMADPPAGVTPRPGDVVGVGSDTIQNVMDQFSHDFNATHTGTKLYSWDATNPHTGASLDNITFKSGCSLQQRPNGSSAGVSAVASNAGGSVAGRPCADFARSSRDRKPTDAPFAKGGLAFITLAGDAVTYATQAGSHAPAHLSTAQLTAIYTCKVHNWKAVGGKPGLIHAFLPQASSGTRAFFLTAINVTTPGSCVSDGTGPTGSIEENEGVNPLLANDLNAIFPYSIGKFIAEKFHSAACVRSDCGLIKRGPHAGIACFPKPGQNLFGCNSSGTMVLRSINGTAPTVGKGPATTINTHFTQAFTRSLFEVVRFAPRTPDHIPFYLEQLFGSRGWVCTNATARRDLLNYGFIILPVCGRTH